MIRTLILFGAAGDLTHRLLLPGVAALRDAGGLPPGFRVVGADRRPPAVDLPMDVRPADVTDPADVAGVLAAAAGGPVVAYLALPTQLMLPAAQALRACGLPAGSRIAVEKPFGTDGPSAAELNGVLAAAVGDAVYRVDHALAMTALVHGVRSDDLARVEVLWEETLALEGRASFYDRAGALRDVMQNHLLQVVAAALAAEPTPAGRAAVLRAARPLTGADVRTGTRRARYTAGRLADGRAVPDYAAEDGVDPARDTETFAEVTLHLDVPGWADVPVVLRAGKALAERRRGLRLHPACGGAPRWLDLDEPADGVEPSAYRRIVADLLGGGTEFSVSADEAELAWQVFTPVLQGWAAGTVPLQSYPAGSTGP